MYFVRFLLTPVSTEFRFGTGQCGCEGSLNHDHSGGGYVLRTGDTQGQLSLRRKCTGVEIKDDRDTLRLPTLDQENLVLTSSTD